ncbi:hypothetical protein BDB00DRAFT_429647 [Zychaea mexicana]|uniref:uncharacterized protein n=1 Tax=Zychaea mexicana TaxID=64656 RepID=UPI0022FE3EAB|nr:uncharacterized protein BDB00DRAFT_429647 [Zychaea mexicana]KAI9492538.1 hypothetical protein BDB00DRAFT_429647 [Zychaea mexicana]
MEELTSLCHDVVREHQLDITRSDENELVSDTRDDLEGATRFIERMLKICTLGCVREQLGYKQNPATSGDRAITYSGFNNQKSFLNAIRHYQALHKRKHVFFQNKGCVAVDIKHRRLFKAPSVIVGRRRRVATAQCVALLFKPRYTVDQKSILHGIE